MQDTSTSKDAVAFATLANIAPTATRRIEHDGYTIWDLIGTPWVLHLSTDESVATKDIASTKAASILAAHGAPIITPAPVTQPLQSPPNSPYTATLWRKEPELANIDWAAVGDVLNALHSTDPSSAYGLLPKAFDTKRIKASTTAAEAAALLQKIAPYLDAEQLVHGNFDETAVLTTNDTPVLRHLECLALGHPALDAAAIVTANEEGYISDQALDTIGRHLDVELPDRDTARALTRAASLSR